MIEFIYGVGGFLLDLAVWVCLMTALVGFASLFVALVVGVFKVMKEELEDG